MWRTIGSIVAGLVAWAVVVTVLNFGLRAFIPGYHAAEATLQFTLAMKSGPLDRSCDDLSFSGRCGWADRAIEAMGALPRRPDHPRNVPAGSRRASGASSRSGITLRS